MSKKKRCPSCGSALVLVCPTCDEDCDEDCDDDDLVVDAEYD